MKRLLIWSVVLLVAGEARLAASSVEVSAKAGVDYSGYTTYTWKARADLDADHPLAEGSQLDRMIKAAAEKQLERSGFERVDDGSAQLEVHYIGYVEDQLQIEGTKKSLGGNVSWVGSPYEHSSRTAQAGTLVFEIVDRKTEQLVWSGWATEVANTRTKLRNKAERATRRILGHFPPQ